MIFHIIAVYHSAVAVPCGEEGGLIMHPGLALSVCVSVCCQLYNSHCTSSDGDLIIGMYTPLRSCLTLTLTFRLKITFLTLYPPGA